MTEFVRFNASFEHKDEKTGQRTRYPALWSGEVEPTVAAAARKTGAVPPAEKAKAETPSSDADAGAGKRKASGKDAYKPSAEVVAARKAVADAEKAVATGGSDEEKAKAEADLKTAQEALASLEA